MGRQYYYKNLGTGMDQFGVHMNFLQIKQVLYINNLFLFYFYLIFEFSGLGHKFQKAQGLLHKAVYDTERLLQDCGFYLRKV
jgi:hypothetical protein